jgi:glycine/D-amino acid oxidase-like deaminating enzyme
MNASRHFVIIGAGIIGCSTAYHLVRMGHKEITVVDRGTLADPLGSTGHAPGLLGRNSASPVMAALADYTAELYASLPAFTRVGSVEVARDDKALALLERKSVTARSHGFRAELISPERLEMLVPYMNTADIVGAIHLPDDGTLEARTALAALHEEAARAGVRFIEETEATDLIEEGGQVVGIRTQGGEIRSGAVVLAAGIWGAEFLSQQNIRLPLVPVQHPYVYTEILPDLLDANVPASHPIVRDLDHVFYLREHHGRLGYGWYNHAVATADVTSTHRADIAFPETGFLDRVSYELFPFLRDVKIEQRLNGVFSMTPDGGPLLGPWPAKPGLWIAEAVWVTHSGGAGRAMAEMLSGAPPTVDTSAFAPDRFAPMAEEDQRAVALALFNDIYAWPEAS